MLYLSRPLYEIPSVRLCQASETNTLSINDILPSTHFRSADKGAGSRIVRASPFYCNNVRNVLVIFGFFHQFCSIRRCPHNPSPKHPWILLGKSDGFTCFFDMLMRRTTMRNVRLGCTSMARWRLLARNRSWNLPWEKSFPLEELHWHVPQASRYTTSRGCLHLVYHGNTCKRRNSEDFVPLAVLVPLPNSSSWEAIHPGFHSNDAGHLRHSRHKDSYCTIWLGGIDHSYRNGLWKLWGRPNGFLHERGNIRASFLLRCTRGSIDRRWKSRKIAVTKTRAIPH